MERPKRCTATTKAGERCKIETGLSPEGLCRNHDPARAERMAEIRRKGGQVGRKPKVADPDTLPGELETLDDCARWLAWSAKMVSVGRIDPRVAREVSTAVREMRGVLEKQLEKELEELRATVARLKEIRVA